MKEAIDLSNIYHAGWRIVVTNQLKENDACFAIKHTREVFMAPGNALEFCLTFESPQVQSEPYKHALSNFGDNAIDMMIGYAKNKVHSYIAAL